MSESEACSQFTPHEVRKLCKMCLKPREEHPLTEEDAEDIKRHINVLNEQPEVKPHAQYAWTSPGCPINRLDEYFKKFTEDKVPRHKSEGQKNRLQRLISQIPPSDLALEKCRFREQTLESEMEVYIQELQTEILRQAEVKEWTQGMAVQCPKCRLILEPDELVVTTAENNGQAFHPACFVCFQCQDILADLIYCSDIDGTVFCVRHYSDKNKKRCHACDELIFSTQYALAGRKFYHKEHLLCYGCDELLQGDKGFEKEEELYCSTCYENKFSRNCVKCQEKISLESRHILYQDDNYHLECFTCNKCKALLSDSPFEIVDEQFLCSECYNKEYAPRCEGCNALFDAQAKVVKYEEKIYHVSCFKCVDCQESIGTGSFVPQKDRVYCKACHLRNFGVRCFRCTYAITDDKGIMYNKKPYHEDCFTCFKCSTKIANRPFKNVDDNLYCMTCFGQEFCKKCHSCDEPILLGADQDVLYSYQDYRWHAACFVCSNCQNSLANMPFTIKEKMMICKNCLNEIKKQVSDENIEQTENAGEHEQIEENVAG